MIIIERSVKLSHLVKEEALSGMTFTGEDGGHKFVITVVDENGVKVPLTGHVSGKFLRPDGQTVALIENEDYAGIENGSAFVTLAGNCYTQAGPFRLVVTHIVGDVRTAIYAFSGYVRLSETQTVVDPESTVNIDAIAAIMGQMQDATEDAEAAAAFVPNVIAPAYSTSATYAVGDYCTKDGKMYRCNTAISTAEGWTAAHWTQVTAGAELGDLKSAITEINYFDSHSAIEGYTKVANGEFSQTSGYYDSNLIKCYPSTTFVIVEEKKSGAQALGVHDLAINFFDASGTWRQGNARYTVTTTEIPAAQSIFGYGGWKYTFTTPNDSRIAYWSVYYASSKWSTFGLYCFYETDLGNYKFKGLTPLSAIYQDKLVPMNWIDGLSDEFDDVRSDSVMSVRTQSMYADWSDFDIAYLSGTGEVKTDAQAYLSDYVAVTPGTLIEFYLRIIGNSKMSGVAWYDKDKNFLGSYVHVGDSGSTWYTDSGSVTLPATARYIRYGGRKYDGPQEKNQFVSYYAFEKIKDYLSNESGSNPWAGKNWVAFGTSITDTSNTLGPDSTPTGKYVPYLQSLSGMSVINKGIAGGTIGIVSGVATGNIMTAIKSSSNLAAIQAADIITLEGFVNDFAANLPIGTIADTDNSTFMGAIYEAVTYLYSQNEDATIVLITESTGQHIDSSHTYPVTRPNSIGKYQYEYNDAIITMAHYLGCHVIDAGQKSQINQWHTEYLADWIHHSELGGKQYAETIWDELKNIHCNSDVSVE